MIARRTPGRGQAGKHAKHEDEVIFKTFNDYFDKHARKYNDDHEEDRELLEKWRVVANSLLDTSIDKSTRLEKLAQLEIDYPMMFEIANPRNVASRMHCGVLEFIAQEGMVYLPYWMMENMRLNEGDIVHLRSATLQKGRYVKLQPQTTDFIKISNPKAVLETVRAARARCLPPSPSRAAERARC